MGQSIDNATAADLVTRHRSGDARALECLITLFRPLIAGAARRVSSSVDIDDVAQETWMSFCRNVERIDNTERVGAWLWTVALNAARRQVRRTSKVVLCDDIEPIATVATICGPGPEDGLIRSERRQALEAAMHSISRDERSLLTLLLDGESLSYHQISELSGRPVGSIGPTRERIVRKLRATPQMARMIVC